MSEHGDERSDEQLMTAFSEGRAGAFDELFARHRRPMSTFLVHQTGERALAEDLFQDVFLRVVRKRADYRPSGSFRAWLFTIARNSLTDARRAGRLGPLEERRERGEERLAELAGGREPDPAASGEARELGRRVAAALRSLPAEQREVFLLRERAGLDFERIAQVTGSRLATVKSRMRYALEGLRRRLPVELLEAAPQRLGKGVE